MTEAERQAWRRRLAAASGSQVRRMVAEVRREMALLAAEVVAGIFDITVHAERMELVLGHAYARTGRQFAGFGREMLAELNDRSRNPIRGSHRAEQSMERDGIGLALARLGAMLEVRETYFGDRVAKLITIDGPERARRIAAHSQEIVTETLAAAAREGLAEDATARRIRAALAEDRLSLSRARTIARTEIGSAQNAGMLAAADEVGVAVNRTWVSIHDGRTRLSHELVDGNTIGPGQKFQVGDALLEHPGDPNGPAEEIINCRCTMLLEPAQ